MAFILCLASFVAAAPNSVTSVDKSVVDNTLGYNLFYIYGTSDYVPGFLPGGEDLAEAVMPSEELLSKFLPESYSGDVTATIYYRTKIRDVSYSELPAKDYYFMDNYTDGAKKQHALIKSADMIIIVPPSGEAISTDITQDDKGNAAFNLSTAVSLPIDIYVVSFVNTPLPKHTVTATAGTGGTITPASADVEEGASQDFKITADKGYVIDTLKVDGSEITAAAGEASFTYTLKDVTKAQSIAVTFKKSETPGKDNVSEAGVSGEGVTAAEPVFIEAADEAVASHDAYADGGKELTLVKEDGSAGDTVTFKKEALVCAVKLEVTHTDPEAAMTLTLSPAEGKSFDAAKKYYAMIQNKKSAAYTLFECAPAASGKLTVTVKPVGDYFSENTVVVYTGTVAGSATPDTPTTGGGSGGGCNAGMAVLALLAFAPFALRRRR